MEWNKRRTACGSLGRAVENWGGTFSDTFSYRIVASRRFFESPLANESLNLREGIFSKIKNPARDHCLFWRMEEADCGGLRRKRTVKVCVWGLEKRRTVRGGLRAYSQICSRIASSRLVFFFQFPLGHLCSHLVGMFFMIKNPAGNQCP